MIRPILTLLVAIAGLAAAAPAQAFDQADGEATQDALAAADARDYADARRIMGRIADPLARKIVDWRLMTKDESGASFEEIGGFLRDNPDWPWTFILLERAEAAMPNDLPPQEVLDWFETYSPRSLEGIERHIAALDEVGRVEEAQALARRTWASDDVSARDEKRFFKRFGQWLEPADHMARVDTFLWKEHTNTATRLIGEYPLPPGAKPLLEARVQLLRGTGPGRNAADRLFAAVPDDRRQDPGLLYAEARWHRKNDRNDEAINVLSMAPADPAHAARWWRERHIMARRMLFEEHDPQTAYALARDHRVADGADFVEAEWTAGWIALRQLDDPETALLHFNRVFVSSGTPISQSRGAYWLARAAEAMGNQGWADQWYAEAARHGTAYYGQAAAARLDTPAVELAPRPAIEEELRASLAARELAQAARITAQAGRDDLTYYFLTALRLSSENAAELQLAAETALELGQPNVAVRAGKDAARMGILLVGAAFPDVPLAEIDIDRAAVRGLIRQESEFNAGAISPAGARGFMQLMPATAKRVARSLGLGYSRGRLTSDSDYNIQLGTAYLRQMLERYDGMAPMALAAYNAGPHRVDRWIEIYGDPRDPSVDLIDWIEAIPYGETRNYVQRVLESMQVYRTLAGDPMVAATDPRTHWNLLPTATAEAGECPDPPVAAEAVC